MALRFSLFYRAFLFCVCVACLAACTPGTTGSRLLEGKLEERERLPTKQERLQSFIRNANQQPTDSFSRLGNDQLVGTPVPIEQVIDDTTAGDVQLNLVDVPVAVGAKAVLGDVLQLNYSVDARVQGNVTVQTSKPTSAKDVLRMFEGALRGLGAAIVGDGTTYAVIPFAEASRVVVPIQNSSNDPEVIGQHPEIIALRFVSAADISEVIEPLVPPGMIVKTDEKRNVIILSGTASEIAAIRETISLFDVDWMKGMSFALVGLKSSDPNSIIGDLEQVFQTKSGPLRNVLRFVPNRRLKSVLIISSRSRYIREATAWIKKFDLLASGNEQNLHVYKVQNRTAAELAKVLQSVLKSEAPGGATTAVTGEVAPKVEQQQVQTAEVNSAGEPTVGPETPATGLGTEDTSTVTDSSSSALDSNGVRVVADDSNNSLLIFASDTEYERILSVLEQVDSQPNQVLLEAVIAEVSLDDDMKFGVKWLFGDGKENGNFSNNGIISQAFPGFSYFLKANDISFTLNALSSVTDVRVLSSPSLVVLDNKTAVLQVGDQVPIVTQQSRGTTSGDSPVINSVELKDTGVILSVTPRVNDSGRVILDVSQEVSSVAKTSTSGIDSPTIKQRKIKTSVVVSDGEALALGGLIQERETTNRNKVPVLGDIPLLGNAFRQKGNTIGRTELIIFIRPRVIRDMEEARRITREFRNELSVQAPRVRRKEPTPGEEAIRILN